MIRHNTNVRKNQKRTALQTKSNNNKNSAVVDDYDDDDHVNIKATVALELLDLLKSGDVELISSSSSLLSQRYKPPPRIEAFLKEKKADFQTVNCGGSNSKKLEQTTKRQQRRRRRNNHNHKRKNKYHDNVKSVQRQQSEVKKSLTSLVSRLEVELANGDETRSGKNKKTKDQRRILNVNEDINGRNNDSSSLDVYDFYSSSLSIDDFDFDLNKNEFDDENNKFWVKNKNKKDTRTNNNEKKNNKDDTNTERLWRDGLIHETTASSKNKNRYYKNSISHHSIQSAPTIMLHDDYDDKQNENSSSRRRRRNNDTCSTSNMNCNVETESCLKKATTDAKDIIVEVKNQNAKLTSDLMILVKGIDDKIAQLEKSSNEKYDTMIQMVKRLYTAQGVPLPEVTIDTDNTVIDIKNSELEPEKSMSSNMVSNKNRPISKNWKFVNVTKKSLSNLPMNNLREGSRCGKNNNDGDEKFELTRGASRQKQDLRTGNNKRGKMNSSSSTTKLRRDLWWKNSFKQRFAHKSLSQLDEISRSREERIIVGLEQHRK